MENRRFFASLLFVLTVLTYAALAAGQTSVPLLINYQGELKSPATGKPVPDGDYDMVFEIFSESTRGISLWQGHYTAANRNPVEVKNGIFNVILGSGAGNGLDTSVFKKPDAWLEITIGRETLEPRQKITSVAYAMVADSSRLLEGKSASDFLSLTDNDSFAAGQGAQADHPGAFVWADSTGDSLASTADNQFLVRATGGVAFDVGDQTMQVNGELQAEKIVYSSPRIHHYSVAAEDFIPSLSSTEYAVSLTSGGVYIKSGAGTLVAPVHLPHGARVTGLNVFFYDDSDARIDVQFYRVPLGGGTPGILSASTSEDISGYGSEFGSVSHVIDNTQNSYRIIAYSSGWEGSTLRVMGAVITYSLEEAP